MYVCTYVAIIMLSTCSSRSMRVRILQLGKDRKRISCVNSNCSSPKQEPILGLNSSIHSQRVIAGRDLENNLLKGRRSRLQYTSLQTIMITVSIINDYALSVCKACTLVLYSLTVVSLMLACAALLLATDYTMDPPKA